LNVYQKDCRFEQILGASFGRADTVSRINEDKYGFIEALDKCDETNCLGVVCHQGRNCKFGIYENINDYNHHRNTVNNEWDSHSFRPFRVKRF